MSVRFTAASQQSLFRAAPFDYNAPYSLLTMVYVISAPTGVPVFSLYPNGDGNNNDRIALTGALGVSPFRTIVRIAGVQTNGDGTTVVLANTWYYFAIVRTSVTTLDLYVGATIAGITVEATNTSGTVAGRTAAGTLELGGSTPQGSPYMDGLLRGARAYATNLTLGEIKTEMASLDAAVKASPWAHWTLKTAGVYTDTTGNGRTLSEFNGPLTQGTDPPVSRRGRRHSAAAILAQAA